MRQRCEATKILSLWFYQNPQSEAFGSRLTRIIAPTIKTSPATNKGVSVSFSAITAKMVANLIVAAGADRVVTMDLHCEQIQGFFDIPVDHVYAGSIIIDHYAAKNLSDLVVVSPDVGAIKMARAYCIF